MKVILYRHCEFHIGNIMATLGQIKGMLLEEVLLYLLRASGYSVVEKADKNDSTIKQGKAGLELLGRGGVHQIDAIADLAISPPFSNPQRLLLEAKCLNKSVGIPVVRNAVGVLKDVGEYWVSRNGNPARARYHYQYALFSAEGYTEPAQRYAYAQDVYLIPLEKSEFIQPVLKEIKALTKDSFRAESDRKISIDLGQFRMFVRESLRSENRIALHEFSSDEMTGRLQESLLSILRTTQHIDNAMVAMISKQFPVFLVPDSGTSIQDLIRNSSHSIRIFRRENSWYIKPVDDRARFRFSFDLPTKLLEMYAEDGLLSQERAVNLKSEHLSKMEALFVVEGESHLVHFKLDRNWLNSLGIERRED